MSAYFRWMLPLRVLGAGGAALVDREYGYNRASQRTSEKRNDDFGLTDRYTYDSAYRIKSSAFDQDGLPGAVARSLTNVSYVMDGVGNRRDVAKQTVAGPVAESYAVNAVNEYVSVAGTARVHDDNGNLTDDGSKLLAFDYKNRLVMATRKADMRPVALYGYLPDGRRSRKQVFDPDTGSLLSDTRFLSDGAQEVEEQDWSTAVTTCTYVWSPVYVDELVSFTNGSGTYFAHQDARCDVVAVTNATGSVVERRRYDDFGKEEIRSPLGAVLSASPSQCEYGFQGRRLDPETGLVFFRARYYDPETGRFVQRDPVWDAGNVGGQYTFVGNGPGSGRDPGGLQAPGPGGWSTADVQEMYGRRRGDTSGEPNTWFERAQPVILPAIGSIIVAPLIPAAVGLRMVQVGLSLILTSLTSHGTEGMAQAGLMLLGVGGSALGVAGRAEAAAARAAAAEAEAARTAFLLARTAEERAVAAARLRGALDDLDEAIKAIPCPPDPVEAGRRLANVDIRTVAIENGLARIRIDGTRTISAADVAAVKDALRGRGATTLVVDSGVVTNPKLAEFLARRAADGKPFQGGTVLDTGRALSPFEIVYPLE